MNNIFVSHSWAIIQHELTQCAYYYNYYYYYYYYYYYCYCYCYCYYYYYYYYYYYCYFIFLRFVKNLTYHCLVQGCLSACITKSSKVRFKPSLRELRHPPEGLIPKTSRNPLSTSAILTYIAFLDDRLECLTVRLGCYSHFRNLSVSLIRLKKLLRIPK